MKPLVDGIHNGLSVSWAYLLRHQFFSLYHHGQYTLIIINGKGLGLCKSNLLHNFSTPAGATSELELLLNWISN